MGIASEASTLELVEAKEEIDKLEYLLEQEKISNARLVKEIDRFEEAFHEAEGAINHHEDEIRRAIKMIKDLKR